MFSSLASVAFALADGAAGAAGGQPGGGPGILAAGGQLVPLIGIAFLFYFMLWRPQAKRQREQQDMLKALKKGDEVVTTGGLIGRISGLTETTVTLEVQEKVRVKVLRSHITGLSSAVGAGNPAAASQAPASDAPK